MNEMNMEDVKGWAARKGDEPAPGAGGAEAEDREAASAGVYDTIRAHAEALIQNADLIAKDVKADGGLHDETAKRLAECLDMLKEMAEELKSIAEDEEKLDLDEDEDEDTEETEGADDTETEAE
jgi:hypothetical protein